VLPPRVRSVPAPNVSSSASLPRSGRPSGALFISRPRYAAPAKRGLRSAPTPRGRERGRRPPPAACPLCHAFKPWGASPSCRPGRFIHKRRDRDTHYIPFDVADYAGLPPLNLSYRQHPPPKDFRLDILAAAVLQSARHGSRRPTFPSGSVGRRRIEPAAAPHARHVRRTGQPTTLPPLRRTLRPPRRPARRPNTRPAAPTSALPKRAPARPRLCHPRPKPRPATRPRKHPPAGQSDNGPEYRPSDRLSPLPPVPVL